MINIMFAGNTKVFDGMTITLLSMVKHTKCQINAFCLTMDLRDVDARFAPITEEQRAFLEKILTEVNPNSSLKLLDITDLFRKEMINSVNLRNHFTPYSMLRLFADMIEEIPDKILYLDTDTVINNNLEELYNINVDDYELGAVTDIYNWASPSRWFKKFYFNAGVLLLNMKKIRETKMLEKTRYLCLTKRMAYMDQDALNKSAKLVKQLPEKFNSKDVYYEDIVVHHFCNVREGSCKFIGKWWHRIKPWEVDFVKAKMSAYDDILDKFLELKAEFNNKQNAENK